MTALEWYFKQIQSKEHFTQDEFDGIYEKAKELEKQQIIDARLTAPSELITYSKTTYLDEAEQYYNETFKNK